VREARAGGPAAQDPLERVRALAEGLVAERRAREQAARVHLSGAIEVLLAYDGPWNLGTLLRRVRAALGAGPYRELAKGTKLPVEETPSSHGPWLAYLASPRRSTIELALDRLADVESEPAGSTAETTLRILNGYDLWIERGSLGSGPEVRDASRNIERLRALLRPPGDAVRPIEARVATAADAPNLHRELIASADGHDDLRPDRRLLQTARAEVARLLRDWVNRELRDVLAEREKELHDLQLDLEVALAGALSSAGPRSLPVADERQR